MAAMAEQRWSCFRVTRGFDSGHKLHQRIADPDRIPCQRLYKISVIQITVISGIAA